MRAKAWVRAVAGVWVAFALAGCGGGGGGDGTSPPPPTDGPALVGADGATVDGPNGATVVIPPRALAEPATVRVAVDGSGAPELPAGVRGVGATYAITPHGAAFSQPVEVRVPAPSVTLQPHQRLALMKAQPGGAWELLDSESKDGMLSASVTSFSYFVPAVVDYPRSLVEVPPWRGEMTTTCGGQDCSKLVGNANYTIAWRDNGGQFPISCANQGPRVMLVQRYADPTPRYMPYARSGTTTRTVFSVVPVQLELSIECGIGRIAGRFTPSQRLEWVDANLRYPRLALLQMPSRVDIPAGQSATVRAVFSGGASNASDPNDVARPPVHDAAVIEWEQSFDEGASWRVVATSYEYDADPRPFSLPRPWRYWQVGHQVTPAGLQGSLLRIRYCYTPPPERYVTGPEFRPCALSEPARINVLAQAVPPTLEVPPSPVLVRTGETANFSAVLGGLPAPSTKWQTRAPGASGAWADVATGTGATTANYTTPPLTLADNGRQYRVVGSNAFGTVSSAGVSVSVSDVAVAPTITSQPGDLTVTAGSDVVFAVAARGTEALSYQWRYLGEPIDGANAAVYRRSAVHLGAGGDYSVQVSNAAGAVVSRTAVLTVLPADAAPPPVAPTIATQPAAVTVQAGNTATFAVGVNGSTPFTFQWRRNGSPIAGATRAAYTIAGVASGDAGSYSVVVSNGAGSVTSASATLAVTTPSTPTPVAPTITTQPASLVQMPGSTATLALAASGSAPLAYAWTRNGTPVPGATGPVLTLANVGAGDAGTYRATVSNGAGSASSVDVTLVVVGAPAISSPPADASAAAGGSATFAVVASGTALRYQWTRDAVAIAGATAATYTTPALTGADSGAVFAVVVYNASGVVISAPAVLTVTAPTGFPANAVPLRAIHADFGQELWITDGTEAGTVLVKDIWPGAGNSQPRDFTRLGSHVYFVANDGSSGPELWRTDGTEGGTSRVADIYPGAEGSLAWGLIACNGRLFFGATDGNAPGVYASDGTAAGTVRLANVILGTYDPVACMDGVVYFHGATAAQGGELWRSDGTVAGTALVADIVPGTGGSDPRGFARFKGQLYFEAAGRLWRSDGTAGGTAQVSPEVVPSGLRVIGDLLYFNGTTAATGSEPWRSDGTTAGTVLLADLVAGSASSYPYAFAASNGVAFFAAQPGAATPATLFRTDGTTAGTSSLGNLRYVSGYGAPLDVNGTLFFGAASTANDYELWKTDGTPGGTVLVADLVPGTSPSYASSFFRLGDLLYFSPGIPGVGYELWRSDGTGAGTVLVKDLCDGCSGDPRTQ